MPTNQIAPRLVATVALAAATFHSGYAAAHSLPLGDGKISSSARNGYVFSCQQRFNKNGPGAQRSGNWIRNGEWSPTAKPVVDGAVDWPNSAITISLEGDKRVVRANNLPKHKTGVYPVARSDDAYQYDRNPNSIRAQNVLLTLTAMPQMAAEPTCVPMGMIGFSLTGAAIYNALDARGADAPAHEIQDSCNGHPERSGQYHYHNYSPCMQDAHKQPAGHSDLIGYALDGFGIFGLKGENGAVVTNASLDTCHGHTHEVMWDGKLQPIYHYHFTEEYPYTIGCFRGQANVQRPRANQAALGGSRQPGQQMGQPPRGGGQMQPPNGQRQGPGGGGRATLQKAASILGVSERQLMDAVGAPPPDFRRASQRLHISEEKIRQAFQTARQ